MEKISSAQNQRVKTVRQLSEKKYREKTDLFLLEGVRLVMEAMEAGVRLEHVFFSETFAASPAGIETADALDRPDVCGGVYLVDDRLFSSLSEVESPQGILAAARRRKYGLEDLPWSREGATLLVVDGVQDPGNLGTIIRTADAAGVDGVVVTSGTVDVYNPKVVRSTMGALFHLPIAVDQSGSEIVGALQEKAFSIIVADTAADELCYRADFSGKLALVVGNENSGPGEAFRKAGRCVRIPCRIESLNVAVATAILLYERVRLSFL